MAPTKSGPIDLPPSSECGIGIEMTQTLTSTRVRQDSKVPRVRKSGTLAKTGMGPWGIDGRLVIEEKALFGASPVTFFEGPPDATVLKPGNLGVNIDLFRQVKSHYNKAKENIACRVLADICQDIQDSGYLGRMDDSAARLSTTVVTVQRWRSRFADNGLLKRQNRNGLYSVDPKVALRMDADGAIVKPTSEKKAIFKF